MTLPPHAARRAQRGFSLIELVVAFALMALVLTTALAISARAYRQLAWSGSAAEAAQWAQSLADEAEGLPLVPGRSHGSAHDGRYQWTREVAEYRDPEGLLVASDGRPLLWRTTLEVSWPDGGQSQSIRLIGLHPAAGVTAATGGPAP